MRKAFFIVLAILLLVAISAQAQLGKPQQPAGGWVPYQPASNSGFNPIRVGADPESNCYSVQLQANEDNKSLAIGGVERRPECAGLKVVVYLTKNPLVPVRGNTRSLTITVGELPESVSAEEGQVYLAQANTSSLRGGNSTLGEPQHQENTLAVVNGTLPNSPEFAKMPYAAPVPWPAITDGTLQFSVDFKGQTDVALTQFIGGGNIVVGTGSFGPQKSDSLAITMLSNADTSKVIRAQVVDRETGAAGTYVVYTPRPAAVVGN